MKRRRNRKKETNDLKLYGWGKEFSHTKILPVGCDFWISFLTVIIAVIGVVAVLSASMTVSSTIQDIKTGHVLIKQSGVALIGIGVMHFMEKHFSLNFLKSEAFFFGVFILGGFLLAPLAWPATYGARAWIYIGSFTLQPSEFAKVYVILIMAAYCGDIKRHYENSYELVKRPLGMIIAYALIIKSLQSDFGSMMVMLLIAFMCLLVPNNKQLRPWQRVLSILAVIALIAGYYLSTPSGVGYVRKLDFMADYKKGRFESCALPFGDMFNDSMHIANSLIAQARGGLLGNGIGKSLSKYYVFPARTTDFILAIMVEETGFLGFFVIFLLYASLVLRLYKYASRIQSEKARIILVGTASYIAIHFIFNVGGVTAAIPLTGIPLLMISSGGTSLLSTMICIGMAQGVIRQYHRGEII